MMPATIVDNITRVLDALGIKGVQYVDIEADRIFAIDRLGELQAHIDAHPELWFKDKVEVFHEHIEGSWRIRSGDDPSLQACKRLISWIPPDHPPQKCRWELDIDLHPTDTPLHFIEHGLEEVIPNALTGHKTNQDEVERRLAERFKETDGQPPERNS